VDPERLAAKFGFTGETAAAQFLLDLLVDGAVPGETRHQLLDSLKQPIQDGPDSLSERLRRLVQLILCLPEYNLC
jgi:hypothetical protein